MQLTDHEQLDTIHALQAVRQDERTDVQPAWRKHHSLRVSRPFFTPATVCQLHVSGRAPVLLHSLASPSVSLSPVPQGGGRIGRAWRLGRDPSQRGPSSGSCPGGELCAGLGWQTPAPWRARPQLECLSASPLGSRRVPCATGSLKGRGHHTEPSPPTYCSERCSPPRWFADSLVHLLLSWWRTRRQQNTPPHPREVCHGQHWYL